MIKRIAILATLFIFCLTTAALADMVEPKAKLLVDKGLLHIRDAGVEKAAKDFMDPDKEFIDGTYYLLFYTYDGTCLALGAKPEIAGKNRWDVQDPDGVYQIREMIQTAKQGGGWVHYKYANPETGTVQKKKTWVQPVPDMDAFVGCGVYY